MLDDSCMAEYSQMVSCSSKSLESLVPVDGGGWSLESKREVFLVPKTGVSFCASKGTC